MDEKLEMDRRLFEAALAGNISALNQLIAENPLILADSALISPHENPLNIAIKAGQLGFAREVIGLRPELAREVNKDGFRPLDIASAFGHIEIVKEILKSCGKDICGLKGRDGRTAIHYAAINGKIEVMDELVSSRAECIKDVTALGETVLHLTVRYYKFESFRKLMELLEICGLEELVNWGDEDGNTILHLAVSRKQHEYVKLLLSNGGAAKKLEINAENKRGLKAMDIMDKLIVDNPSDIHIRETLQRAGAAPAISPIPSDSKLHHVAVNVAKIKEPETSPTEAEKEDWIKYFRFQQLRDSPSDTRNVLLVVAALIATVTFQAGVNPPNGFTSPSTQNVPMLAPAVTVGLGTLFANLGSLQSASQFFLFGNSLGLASSICVIIYLTSGFPFQRELHISIYSMLFAYGWSIQDIDSENRTRQHIIMGSAFLLPFLLRWLPRWAKRIWRWFKKKDKLSV
ncbi:ankyrin repeat-containing protein BDA1-like [Ziziphus jujuba]|uniref:Ankyrin repeat-containing protein BDA1-like n=1 Tax=Ziziphus jujuba TaxID=326968 RepID=A0ABM4AAD7_ZIZJJ|nr:ankyrin repeat-containing protein BDA1-like [Ziziphus jujuba]